MSTKHASTPKLPVTPREAASNGSQTPRAQPPLRGHRLASAVAKANDTHTLRKAYDTWRAYLTRRHQQVHLKRCAVALKHGNNRQQYARFFVRWLAAAQQSAAGEAKALYTLPKEFPLRTRKDVLSLVSRYFHRWRRCLRERRQRTEANVALLERVNTERTLRHTFTAWLLLHQRQRDDVYRERFQEAEQHLDGLASQLHTREKEVGILQRAVERVTTALNGNPTGAQGTPRDGETARDSLARTMALADAVDGAVEDVLRNGSGGDAAAAPTDADRETAEPSLASRLRAMGSSLDIAEAARQQAKEEVEQLNALVAALAQMVESSNVGDTGDNSGRPSAAASPKEANIVISSLERLPSLEGSPSPPRALSSARGSRVRPSADGSRQLSPQQSRNVVPSTPSPYLVAKAGAENAARELADAGNDLPLRLLEATVQCVASEKDSKAMLAQRAAEVADLREAALRAVDILGGRREKTEALFAVHTDDTVEQSAKRSNAVASALSDLCEDLVVVLVLASLWSQDGVKETVSETLERMCRALEQAGKDLKWEQDVAEGLTHVVAGSAELVGVGLANSARETDDVVEKARVAAKSLEETRKMPVPRQLLDFCLSYETTQANRAREMDEQRELLAQRLEDAAQELTAAKEETAQREDELEKVKRDLADTDKALGVVEQELVASQEKETAAAKEVERAARKLADTEEELAILRDQAKDLETDAQQTLQARNQELAELREALRNTKTDLAESEKDLGEAQQALVAARKESEQTARELQDTAHKLVAAEEGILALQAQVKQAQDDEALARQDGDTQAKKLRDELDAVKLNLADSDKELAAMQLALVASEEEKEVAQEQLAAAAQELAEVEHALQESKEHACDLSSVLDGVLGLLESPQSAESDEVVRRSLERAATLADKAALTVPARCLQLVEDMRSKLHDALAGIPESVAADGAMGPESSLVDQVAALSAWRDELLRDMHEAIQVNVNIEAVSAFLRDVLRDVIHRLVQMREGGGDEDSMLSTRVSLSLDPDEPPRPLVRGDPSAYVEYILHLQGTNEVCKRAVQDHLAVGGVLSPSTGRRDGGSARDMSIDAENSHGTSAHVAAAPSPSTWDVIADVHENLAALVELNAKQSGIVLEQKEVNEQLSRANGALRDSLDNAHTVLQNWSNSTYRGGDHTRPPSINEPPKGVANSLVADFDAEVGAVVEALRQLKDVVDEDLASTFGDVLPELSPMDTPVHASEDPSPNGSVRDLAALVSAVANMRKRLVDLQHSAEDGITALGGSLGRHDGYAGGAAGSDAAGDGVGRHLHEVHIAERLAAICRDTGASIEEAKKILGLPPGTGQRLTLRDVLPNIQAKIYELEDVKRDSEAFVRGLDSAFNDDNSSLNSSCNSSVRTAKSLKAKKKPLPALEGSPTELMAMTHREIGAKHAVSVTHRSVAGLSPKARLDALRSHALGKIDEVQDLRSACRAIISIVDGSFVEGEKPPSYGDVLVPLLLSQVEDIKKALPLCNAVVNRNARNALGSRKNGIAFKLTSLASIVESLEMERDGLRDELAGKARQNHILLEDIDRQTEDQTRQAQNFRSRIKELSDANADLRASEHDLKRKLDTLEIAREQLDADTRRLEDLVSGLNDQLAEEAVVNDELTKRVAQRQHENNVLTNALGTAILEIGATGMEENTAAAAAAATGDEEVSGEERRMPRTVADMELLLLHKLSTNEGAPLSQFVEDQVAAVRARWGDAVAGSLAQLEDVRGDMAALRDRLENAWERELKPLCTELLADAEEEAELLRVENAMLRPRAVEREALLKEAAVLQQRLADAEAALAAAEEATDAHAAANSELRKALSEAQVTQVIRSISASNGTGEKKAQPSVDVAELERRMIRGATALTMEAINAMSGENMAHVFGDVAARTVRLHRDLERCLRDMQEALHSFEHSRNPHALAVSVESGVGQLEELSTIADRLWSNVPELFQIPFTDPR